MYEPARPAGEVKPSLLDGILKQVFRGSPVDLVESLVRHEHLTDDQLEEIRRLIDDLATDPARRLSDSDDDT